MHNFDLHHVFVDGHLECEKGPKSTCDKRQQKTNALFKANQIEAAFIYWYQYFFYHGAIKMQEKWFAFLTHDARYIETQLRIVRLLAAFLSCCVVYLLKT